VTDHYAVLGVARDATHEQIRRAYRERMRKVHPDSAVGGAGGGAGSAAGGGAGASASSAAEVTRITQAWSVLSSPARRAAYDVQLAPRTTREVRTEPSLDYVYPRARFPWRFVLVVIGLGTALLLVLHIVGDPMPPRGIDGLVSSGSCLDFDNLGAAYEVPCDGPHQAVARELVPFGAPCDSDTTQARDRQGMGTVCIEP
jgi:curved DNA-binding protein CbpA